MLFRATATNKKQGHAAFISTRPAEALASLQLHDVVPIKHAHVSQGPASRSAAPLGCPACCISTPPPTWVNWNTCLDHGVQAGRQAAAAAAAAAAGSQSAQSSKRAGADKASGLQAPRSRMHTACCTRVLRTALHLADNLQAGGNLGCEQQQVGHVQRDMRRAGSFVALLHLRHQRGGHRPQADDGSTCSRHK